MNLNQLRIFYESARQHSFTRAAEHLCVSQPAVSSQIKQLEAITRLKLFTKVGRKIYLTEAGEVLFGYAQKIFQLELEAEDTLDRIRRVQTGALHVGTTKTYARFLMPNYISMFHALYPGISIHLSEGSSMEMMQSLLHMKNELAIVASDENPRFLNSIIFRKENILLVISPDHPLAKKGSVNLEDVSKVPLIMREEGSGTRKIVMEAFRNKGLTPTILYEASNLEFTKELLKRGEGASFIVEPVVHNELKQGVLREVKITDTPLSMDAYIVFLSEKNLSRTASCFMDMLVKRSQETVH
ncbi:MAG: LysR substrate-binding domain-containing protein [Syntrophorhabdaceae bacterium]|nr:LysR substrate-binding domain-containing protein [Syntrophorhabdaceae bacterium]